MTRRRVHMDATAVGELGAHGLCGLVFVETSFDAGTVTCRMCLRRMHTEREQIPDYVDDRWFAEETVRPLPQGTELSRKAARLWRDAFEGIARIVAESDARRSRMPGPRTVFVSVEQALATMVAARVHGYGSTSVNDPDRLKRLTDGLCTSSAPSDQASQATREAERVVEARRSLDRALMRTPVGHGLSTQDATELLLRRYVARQRPAEIEEGTSMGLDAKAIGRVSRSLYAAIWEDMVWRGLIPTPTGAVADSEGTDMANVSGADLHGWKEIADFLGVSRQAAMKWEKEHGLPVHRKRYVADVEAYADEIREWDRRQTVRPQQCDGDK